MSIEEATGLGKRLLSEGRHGQARSVFKSILAAQPENTDVMLHLGIAHARMNAGEEAARCFEGVLAAEPHHVGAMINRAHLSFLRRDYGVAAKGYRGALDHQPENPVALSYLGRCLHKLRRGREAVRLFERALTIDPNDDQSLRHLVRAFVDIGDGEAAMERARQLLRKAPEDPEARALLGDAEFTCGEIASASDHYEVALKLDPENVPALEGLAILELDRGACAEAEDCWRRILARFPDSADHHFNLAHLLLLTGRYDEGWREYEWRRRRQDFLPLAQGMDPALEWGGEALDGGRLLVRWEQGLGDFIQFARYLHSCRERGCRVVLECPPELLDLMKGQDIADEVFERRSGQPPDTKFDRHIWMLSLPRVFGTTRETIPREVPYLSTDAERVWHLPGGDRLNVGLVWAGNPAHPADAKRSIPLSAFLPLSNVGGIQLCSLQKGPATVEVDRCDPAFRILRLDRELGDFADAASLMQELDLVISVDTAPAHLAGALAVPVWTLLHHAPDWRWGPDGGSTPWYPTMRLFRQRRRGEWGEVIDAVVRSLEEIVSDRV